MSHPPGTPDPNDPWATPSGEPTGSPAPQYGQPPHDQPQYGQPQYGQPPYGGYPLPTNPKALGALWTGIAALVLSLCCGAGILLGPVSIVLGAMARREIRTGGGQQGGSGIALSGIITGVVALVLSLAAIAFLVLALLQAGAGFDTYDRTTA